MLFPPTSDLPRDDLLMRQAAMTVAPKGNKFAVGNNDGDRHNPKFIRRANGSADWRNKDCQ
jgi:hypothetical protein